MKQKLLYVALPALFSLPALAGTVTTDGQDLVISTNGGLKVHTADKSASIQLGGRIQWDYDDTDSDTSDSTDLDIRRARLFVKGNISDWAYKIQFNVAESSGTSGGTAEDLYIRYTGWGKKAQLTVGKQKEPLGLEELTSSKDISSLERSAMTELYAPGRSSGIQLSGKGSNWTYGAGVFEANGDSSNDFDSMALTARGTYVPFKDDHTLVHLGAAISSRQDDKSTPEKDDVDIIGLEAAATFDSLHAQAEYFDAEMGNEDMNGYYLQVGYIITGETRPYKDGAFKRVKPAKKSGAWEVVLRVEDGDGKYKDIGVGSGDGSQTTLGVNWYVNNNVKLGLSYMDGENDDNGQDGSELRARLQLVF
jgi:phosphate-selective porin OprO/OprP